jgi:hypothetical protein
MPVSFPQSGRFRDTESYVTRSTRSAPSSALTFTYRAIAFKGGAYGRDRTARQGDAMTPRHAARPTGLGAKNH